jgi:site-specific DNA recombinase
MNKVSVDYQREQLLALCRDRLDCTDPIEYLDRNVSATTGRRAAYEDMCEDIRNGVIGRVAVWDMDRLHRQPRELEDFIDLAERFHVDLANVGGDVDLSTPSGRMFARMKGTVAKYEVEQKSVRQKAANAERAKRGSSWNMRVFGYDGDEIVWDEANAIREACEALLDGDSLWGIARRWNAAGLTSVKGSQWSGSQVRRVLLRPRNAALAVYDVHGAVRDGGKITDAILEGVEVTWPPVVSRDTYDAVCGLLADPSRHTGKKRALVHLLSGLAYCGLCERKMGTTTRKTKTGAKRVVYQCKNVGCMKVVRDLARTDAHVVRVITERLARADAAKLFAKPTEDTKELSKRASEIRGLIKAAENEYDDGIIDGRDLKRRRDKLQPQLDAVGARLVGSNTGRKLDGLLGQPDAAQRFAALGLDRRRAVIDTVATVTILPTTKAGGIFDPKDIRIDWR